MTVEEQIKQKYRELSELKKQLKKKIYLNNLHFYVDGDGVHVKCFPQEGIIDRRKSAFYLRFNSVEELEKCCNELIAYLKGEQENDGI